MAIMCGQLHFCFSLPLLPHHGSKIACAHPSARFYPTKAPTEASLDTATSLPPAHRSDKMVLNLRILKGLNQSEIARLLPGLKARPLPALRQTYSTRPPPLTTAPFLPNTKPREDVSPGFKMADRYPLPLESSFDPDNPRVHAYSASRHARRLFFAHPAPNVNALNTLLTLYSRNGGRPGPMVSLYDYALERGIEPDIITYNQIISAYGKHGTAQEIHRWIRKAYDKGLTLSLHSWVPLVMCHTRAGNIEAAERVLSEMYSHGIALDTQLYNAIIGAMCVKNMVADMERLSRQMKDSGIPMDEKTWSRFVEVYANCNDTTQAIWAFTESFNVGLESPFGIVHLSKVLPLRDILELLHSLPLLPTRPCPVRITPVIANALIGQAVRINDFGLAFFLLSELKVRDNFQPNPTTYSMIIDAYAKDGDAKGAVSLLQTMKEEEGIEVDIVIYTQVMTALSEGPGMWMVESLIKEVHEAAAVEGSKVVPNIYFYNSALKCASAFCDADAALNIMDEIISRRIATDPRTIQYFFRTLLASGMSGRRVWRLWGKVKYSVVSASFKSSHYVLLSLCQDEEVPTEWIWKHAVESMDRLDYGRAGTIAGLAIVELCRRGSWDGEDGAMGLWNEAARRRIRMGPESIAALLHCCVQEDRWVTAEVIWEKVEEMIRVKDMSVLESPEVAKLWMQILAQQARWIDIQNYFRRLDQSIWAGEAWVDELLANAPQDVKLSIEKMAIETGKGFTDGEREV
ncbi:hypothetical protein BJ684DRAFT_17124 [Piptocephalis cylindrospora]|uniref:Pentacotripeptide-repeat region of PRORP domain-containing protein n=1 Tax=Piptocephalis cylindrospora TaxID=1907219 RepID=A0A4P9Y0V7_9FUNG|nr:hypothetical protein BJ684DRAFT_17124 [Piptocephalis cylindrospora]|eukprot:RKP12378.1 hypothetical protein BJ684DRAFT_17124 [Piptocephalis cylindrospora]